MMTVATHGYGSVWASGADFIHSVTSSRQNLTLLSAFGLWIAVMLLFSPHFPSMVRSNQLLACRSACVAFLLPAFSVAPSPHASVCQADIDHTHETSALAHQTRNSNPHLKSRDTDRPDVR